MQSLCQDVDMCQGETVGPVEESVGYVLKQAAAALRAAMDAALRPLELTVPQYACLELLGQRPGLSNAELARGAFVTRQSMNGVLRGLQDRGLLTRPPHPEAARCRPNSPPPAASGCTAPAPSYAPSSGRCSPPCHRPTSADSAATSPPAP